ncbi:MAG: hypothetical protein IKN66_11770 [Ruminococcus sp.]|nr:hypothetical protein [Ruminococcus sp.]
MKKVLSVISTLALIAMSGCSSNENSQNNEQAGGTENSAGYEYHISERMPEEENTQPTVTADGEMLSDIYVTFGGGQRFAMHPYNNDTAAELIRNIGSDGKRLPIYDFKGYEGDDVFQYYDIPSRFEIPSVPEHITAEKSGEIYYSTPNRIMLFFGDAQIEGDFTKVGYIDDSEEYREAVRNNPVVEGWGNLIVAVSLD